MSALTALPFLLFTLIALFYNCEKANDNPAPTIIFKTGSGYTSSDVILASGNIIKVGIKAESNCLSNLNCSGMEDLSKFTVFANETEIENVIIDYPHKTFFEADINITKNVYPEEFWAFTITDESGKSASLSLTLERDTTGGEINDYASIILGAQNNETTGSFFSLTENLTYSQTDAYANQELIDFIYYFDGSDGGTEHNLASPDAVGLEEYFTDTTGISNWTLKNKTRFIKTSLSVLQFDFIDSDLLLISSFSGDKKRIASNLKTNDIYSFKTQSGKYGLFKVNDILAGTNGNINVAVKFQQ